MTDLFSGVEIGKLLTEVLDLRRIVVGNIGIVWMQGRVILMILFGRIEGLKRHDLRGDRLAKNFGGVELRDIGAGNLFLLVAAEEDHGAILRAFIGALAIQFGGIVGYGEKIRSNSP